MKDDIKPIKNNKHAPLSANKRTLVEKAKTLLLVIIFASVAGFVGGVKYANSNNSLLLQKAHALSVAAAPEPTSK